ncbi:LuxR C-terminal-related transcriptional regulator [Streptomyces sp. NPDC060085]|uniref:helix-turn-helix transcriptional regulator n=1 Tax=Streptomyces sp. NPDC060085 TaxID=3347054 RepID=UPI00365449C7
MVQKALPDKPDPEFEAACHDLTGGNPLLLAELLRTVSSDGIVGIAQNSSRLEKLTFRTVDRSVALRMSHLPSVVVQVASAASVLGDGSDLNLIAALTNQPLSTVVDSVRELERLDILHLENASNSIFAGFVHPLVRSSIYRSIGIAGRAVLHRHAALLLKKANSSPERVAAHLLRVPPAGDQELVEMLCAAADEATARSAPGNAYAYLRRAVEEPPGKEFYLDILIRAGNTALLVDFRAAADLLRRALDLTSDPTEKANVAILLGMAHLYLEEADTGIDIWSQALEELPADAEEVKRHLESSRIMAATFIVSGRDDVLRDLPALRNLPQRDTSGARLLESAISGRELTLGDPLAGPRAKRALSNIADLVDKVGGDVAIPCGWHAMLAIDDDDAMDNIQAAVTHAYSHGSLYTLVPAYMLQTIGWLMRGQLSEAEATAREALNVADLTGADITRIFITAYLSEVLTESGRLEESENVLKTIGVTYDSHPAGPFYFPLEALSKLHSARGNQQDRLDCALRVGEMCAKFDIRNPAFVSWRTEAAQALQLLSREKEALTVAAEDLQIARGWGAPRTYGRSLRVNGVIMGGRRGVALLAEAVNVLEKSPAQLELAKALVDLGAALRRSKQRSEARTPLHRAIDLATRCGAAPLADQARTELAAAGGAAKNAALVGPEALTPSERRVAEMASQGITNRQIAQILHVTSKTIEVHLSSVYRKLGIGARTQIAEALKASG